MKETRASITIEISCIVPLFLLILYLSIMGTMYFHDKNILTACAYEALTTAVIKGREEEPLNALVEQIFHERIRGKCILFPSPNVEVEKDEVTAAIRVKDKRKMMKIDISFRGYITEPEKQIRKYKTLQEYAK